MTHSTTAMEAWQAAYAAWDDCPVTPSLDTEAADQAAASVLEAWKDEQVRELRAENEVLKSLVRGWHYLAVGPDEMGDYYTQKQLIKASEPYALRTLLAEERGE